MGRPPRIVATLDRIARLLDELPSGPLPREAVARAHGRATELVDVVGEDRAGEALALLGFTAELLAAIAVDLAAQLPDAIQLIDRLEEAGVSRAALGREVLRVPQLPTVPVEVAIEAQLALLLAFTGADAVSLWTASPGGELRPISNAGAFDPHSPATREAARVLLRGDPLDRGEVVGARVDREGAPPGAVVIRGAPRRAGDQRHLLAEATAPALGAMLERHDLLSSDAAPEEAMMRSLERRLARLRYDLHDGPQQDVHLLASDLDLFRNQLRPALERHPNAERLFGRLDDIAAQLVALDGDLRRLSSSMQSPFLHPGSLPDALREVTNAFAARAGVIPETRLEGDLVKLTDSQQITLLALIREALSNIRQHSDARRVTIAIAERGGRVSAEVRDDGRGFDPETTLVQAARDGHLGLVGMHERVRMLGGQTRIDSRPGGPTVISVSLPPWPADEPEPR